MAFAIRNVIRNQNITGSIMEDDNFENRQALIREEEERQRKENLNDQSLTELEQQARKSDKKRKEEAAEQKKQLQAKKNEKIGEMLKKLKINDSLAFVLALFGVVLAFIEAENYYDNGNQETSSNTIMRTLILISSIILAATSVRHYLLNYSIARERQTTSTGVGTSFSKSLYFKLMLLEVSIVIICCPPGLDIQMTFSQLAGTMVLSADAVLTCLMLLRIFLLARVVKHYSKWANEHSRAICEEQGCYAGSLFVLKALFKDKPYLMIAVVMSISILIFGLATRTFERPYVPDYGVPQDYGYVWNAFWLIVLTMTTVGYGDFYPCTHMGRFVVILACFWGVFIVSIMVVTLNESSKFSKAEQKAFTVLERLRAKDNCMVCARTAIISLMKLNVINRKKTGDEDARVLTLNRMHRALATFKIHKQKWKGLEISEEERLRQLTDKLDKDLEELKTQVGCLVTIDDQMSLVEEFQSRSMQTVEFSIRHLEDILTIVNKQGD